jgi:hypothetical protein
LNSDVLKDLARWVHRSTKARANSKQSNPAEKIILLGRATVRISLRKSKPLLFLKEMNILSAHRIPVLSAEKKAPIQVRSATR